MSATGTSLKRCGNCREEKPLSAFHKRYDTQDGRAFKCKVCVSEYDRSRSRDYSKETTQRRDGRYFRDYAITVEQYNAMVDEQEGLCAICQSPETKTVRGTVSRLRSITTTTPGVSAGCSAPPATWHSGFCARTPIACVARSSTSLNTTTIGRSR